MLRSKVLLQRVFLAPTQAHSRRLPRVAVVAAPSASAQVGVSSCASTSSSRLCRSPSQASAWFSSTTTSISSSRSSSNFSAATATTLNSSSSSSSCHNPNEHLADGSSSSSASASSSSTIHFNDDHLMSDHHMQYEQPHPQEWGTFHGKISVLKEAKETTEEWQLYGEHPRTCLLMELSDRVGVLHDVLRYFWKYDVNVCRIESRPHTMVKLDETANETTIKRKFDFFVDFEGNLEQENVQKLLQALRPMTDKLLVLDEKKVHWFPRHISELDLIAGRTLEAGTDLESDHPGFRDPLYRERRAALTAAALQHRWDSPIARMDYTAEETAVWAAVWDRMQDLWQNYACKEYLHSLELMMEHCGYSRDNIPQQADISEYLQRRTHFHLRPVAGLLSSRDFLNGLAFRVFFCTQYIRHASKPLYTPEPDICHELLGHVPMFADRDFADFSQEIGLASLGASDEIVEQLARCYWHSVEFGLCLENHNQHKAYGAGLLSSFGELEYACAPHHPGGDNPPEIKPWDPAVAAKQPFPITSYQPVYFLAESLQDAKDRMRAYCEDLPRPFFANWNPQTNTIHIDRPVQRTKGQVPPATPLPPPPTTLPPPARREE